MLFAGIAEYKNFNYVARELPVSDIDRNLNHVGWKVSTFVKHGIPYRVWHPYANAWDRRWAPLGGETGGDLWGNSLRTQVVEQNGIVTYNGVRSDSFNPAHLNCSALPSG